MIEEESNPELVRDGNDLIHNLNITVTTALLGGTVEVPTVDGRAKIKIAPGTHAGKVLRLGGKGLPDVNGYGRGDELVVVDITIPSKLSAEEKRLVEPVARSGFGGSGFGLCRRRTGTQEHIGELRIKDVDEQQDDNCGTGHLPDAHTPLVILLGTAGGTGITLRTDILSGTVLTIPVFGPLAAKFGTALLACLLFGIVVARYVVELVGVSLERGET